VCFGTRFPVRNMRWIIHKQKVVVDENYDSSGTSMYVFRGNLYFYKITNQNKETISL
jgi:hypothetical protein